MSQQQQQKILEREVCTNKWPKFSQILPKKGLVFLVHMCRSERRTLHRTTDQGTLFFLNHRLQMTTAHICLSTCILSWSIEAFFFVAKTSSCLYWLSSQNPAHEFSVHPQKRCPYNEPVHLWSKSIFSNLHISVGGLINIQPPLQCMNEKTRFQCTDRIYSLNNTNSVGLR